MLHIWVVPALSFAWGLLCIYGVVALADSFRHRVRVSPVVFLFLGLFWVSLSGQIHQWDQLKVPVSGQSLTVEIQGLIKSSDERHQIIVREIKDNKQYLLNLYSAHAVPWQAGDVLSVVANLKPPHGTVNTAGFDRERWLFRRQIVATGTIKSWQLKRTSTINPIHHISRWRAQVISNWQESISKPKVRALLMALSVGDKSQFGREDFKRFQDTGTAHLVAISGLHIGMMAAVGYGLGWLLFAFWPTERLPRPKIQALSAWIMAAAYAVLAGLAVPTLRALLMLSVYLLFQFIKRQAYAWDVWCLSLFVLVLLDPLGVLDLGLFLSFGAVAILIFAFQGRGHAAEQRHGSKVGKGLTWLKAQWVLLLGLMPLQLMMLGRVNWVAPLVNFLAIPLMTFMVVPLLFVVMLWQLIVGTPPDFLITVLVGLCDGFYLMLGWFESLPHVSMEVVALLWWQWLLLVLVLFIVLLPRAIPQRFWVLMLLIPLMFKNDNPIPSGYFNVQFFDVGQGLAVAIHTQNHHMLYDVAAAYDSGFNWAEAVIVPGLKQQGIKQLDAVVVSHQDNDHAGGLPFLINEIPTAKIYGTLAGQTPCIKGVQWQWDGVTFEVLSPYNLKPYLKNNSSCVLKVHAATGSLLLTGDIESAVEYRLSQQDEHLKSDVMLMPHHGSKTSSTDEFIAKVGAQWVVNSSGQYNPFHHPAAAVMARYEVPVFDTQSSGQITATNFPRWQFDSLRESNPKVWRRSAGLDD